MKKVLIAGALLAVAVAVFLAYQHFFGEKTSFETASISPDGVYRCEVREVYRAGQCRATIKVFRRNGSGHGLWTLLKTERICNDSACRSNYSVDWQYDEHHRTERLIVFGDFGTPPLPGEIIFEMAIADGHEAKTTGEPAASSQASPRQTFAQFVTAMQGRELSRVIELIYTSPEDKQAVALWAEICWIVQDGRTALLPSTGPNPLPAAAVLDAQHEIVVIGNRAEMRSNDDQGSISFVCQDGMWKIDFGTVKYHGGSRDQVITALQNVVNSIHRGVPDLEVETGYAIEFTSSPKLSASVK